MSAASGEDAAAVEVRFQDRIARSITSATVRRRTVDDPDQAAVYASNALLHHDKALLAEAAVTHARAEVEALLGLPLDRATQSVLDILFAGERWQA